MWFRCSCWSLRATVEGCSVHVSAPPPPPSPGHEVPFCPQGSEVVDQVLHTVSKSNSLEELTLENAGLKS